MSGRSSHIRDYINRAAPSHASVTVSERGLSMFVDPSLSGRVRFSQKSGYPFPLLTPQKKTTLALAYTAGSRVVVLSDTRINKWLVPGVTLSFEQVETARIISTSVNSDGTTTVNLASALDAAHAAGSAVNIKRYAALPAYAIAAGAGGLGEAPVELDSPFFIITGDSFYLNGKKYTVTYSEFVSEGPAGLRYLIKVSEAVGIEETPTGVYFDFEARPAYISGLLTMPTANGSLLQGPIVLDAISGPVVADYRPAPDTLLTIEEYDISGRLIVGPRPVRKNDGISRVQINRDQILFWNWAEGGANWNGSFTELHAYESGRVHVWTPCRPVLDPAPEADKTIVVPSFSPYQVNLGSRLGSNLTVFDNVTKDRIASSLYSVDTEAGTVSFDPSLASTQVVIRYQPRLSWRMTVRPSVDDIELCVKLGGDEKMVFTLGPAGTTQSLSFSTVDTTAVDSVHITARRVDDGSGPFKVDVGDITPAGTQTSAFRYTVSTGADEDYDWASSGLLMKAMWPNLDLVRARLDGDTTAAALLDAGKILL